MSRDSEFVADAYRILYPYSGGLHHDIRYYQAIDEIATQLDVLCQPGMKAVMVVIMAALHLKPRENENAAQLCRRLRERLELARKSFPPPPPPPTYEELQKQRELQEYRESQWLNKELQEQRELEWINREN